MEIGISKGELEATELIGNLGTYGQLWKGKWNRKENSIEVSIKKIRLLGITESQQDKIIADIEPLTKLQSSHLIHIFGACFVEHELWIVMEYMQGESLFDRLHSRNINSREKISWETRLRLAHQAIISVHALHSCEPPILHRDIKSQNFVVSKDLSTLKLTDVGFSKFITVVSSMPSKIGVPRWGAPETFDYPPKWSPEADIYSIGCTFYELATRRIPFIKVTEANLRSVVQSGKRPPLPQQCPEEFAQIIKECWDNKMENRPSSQQLMARLELLVADTARISQMPLENDSESDDEPLNQETIEQVATTTTDHDILAKITRSGPAMEGSIPRRSQRPVLKARNYCSDTEAEFPKGKWIPKIKTEQKHGITGLLSSFFKNKYETKSRGKSFQIPLFGKSLTCTLLGTLPRLYPVQDNQSSFFLSNIYVSLLSNGSATFRHKNWVVTVSLVDIELKQDATDRFYGTIQLLMLKSGDVEEGLSVVNSTLKHFFILPPRKTFAMQFHMEGIKNVEFSKSTGLAMFDSESRVALIYRKPFCTDICDQLRAKINWNNETKRLLITLPEDATKSIALVFAIPYSGTVGEFGFEIANVSSDEEAEMNKKKDKKWRRRSTSSIKTAV